MICIAAQVVGHITQRHRTNITGELPTGLHVFFEAKLVAVNREC